MCIQTLSSFRQPSLKAYLKTNLSSWHLSWFDWQLYHPWFKSMHNTYSPLRRSKFSASSRYCILFTLYILSKTRIGGCVVSICFPLTFPPINCTIGRHITLHILIYQGYINLERLPYMPIKATTKNPSQNITI